MKTLILKIAPLLLLGLWPGLARAQTIATNFGAVNNCPGTTIVPILVTNCNNVGAISLKFSYTNTVLTYQGYQDVHSELAGGLLIINSTGSKIIFSWASTNDADIGNDTLVELIFNGVPGTSTLTWETSGSGNCEFSDINGSILPATFTNSNATIYQNPVINTQPVNASALVGQNATFTVSASATDIAYRWQLSTNNGDTWSDLTNVAPHSEVTTPTLTVSNCLLTYNGYKYRCHITGTCSPDIYTNAVTLTVINPITTTLPTLSLCPGSVVIPVTVTNFNGVASFSLTFAYNTSFLTYTGYQSLNGALTGGYFSANASGGKVFLSWSSTVAASFGNGTIVEVLFNTATGASALNWDTQTSGNCEYTDINGIQIPSVFVNGNVTLFALPTVVTHPLDKIIAKGQNTSFSITASGSGLAYLWQVSTDDGESWTDLTNSGFYFNVTTATLDITGAQFSISENQYRCKVTGTCQPVVYSNPAKLTVLPNVITSCVTLSSCPGQISVPVKVVDFIDVGAFSLTLTFSQTVLTYAGYTDLNGAINSASFAAYSSNGKVYLTWYALSPATIANNDTMVQILFNSLTGSSTLSWDTQTPGNCEYSDTYGLTLFSTWNNGNATIYQPPLINSHPVNKTTYSGGSTTFSVTATGTGLAYIWQVSADNGQNWSNLTNTSPYNGVTTSTLTINPAGLGLNGYQYRCYVTGTCTPFVWSNVAILTVTPAAITTTAASISNACNRNLVIPVSVTNCNNIGAISLTLTYDPTKLTYDGYQLLHSELSPGFLNINATATQVKLSWASTNPADIGNGTLLEYRFKAVENTSTTLTWDTQTPGNCEFTNMSGLVITSFYNNSTISVANNALNVNAGSDLSIMPGGSTQLNGSVAGGTTPYTYAWTPVTGLSNPAILNPIASPASSTIYTLTVTDFNSCSGFDPVTVMIVTYRTWTGAIDEKWDVPGNWNPSGVPNPSEDVYIPATVAIMPEVKALGMTCNNLFMDPDALLTIKPGFTLTVNGNFEFGTP